ncbi:hypothetical protein ABZ502_17205 [Streptomyces abikoensis]|uniref:hypothetical protein n=1 Tax=Streptomyces abikoensis TaxID=97398 RepID=UPI0033DE3B25
MTKPVCNCLIKTPKPPTHTVDSDFGTLYIQRIDATESWLNLRTHPWRTTYAVDGNDVDGYVSIDPHYYDTSHNGHPDLPTEQVLAEEPNQFFVRCGHPGGHRRIPGTPKGNDGILLINGLQVLTPEATFTNDGFPTALRITHRTGPYTDAPAPLQVTAKTCQVIQTVLQIHITDTEHTTHAAHLYSQHCAPQRRALAQAELERAQQLLAEVQVRIQRTWRLLDHLGDQPPAEPRQQ